MFAVIHTGGKQYRVAQNDILSVERLDGEPGDSIDFDKVLMVGEGDDIDVVADGASVKAEILEHNRADKILIFKKKRRKHYRRRGGHRQQQTVVKITEILAKGAKKPAAKKVAKKAAASDAEAAPAAAEA
ncbi:MAG: 50S ribosomal protein L21 [Rhodospirillaceae bacterium]|nr:50S ribosomal protein L21 [Rhodospirillaceae bacterium]|tara:strand:+ start:6334 stop:6723 length:390 start_codon:yes stop_codon:yes gene_type:complete